MASKWTRVALKKPPKGTLVLCASMEADTVAESFWVGWMAGNAWLRDNSKPSITPTHWMEIPAIIEVLESLSRKAVPIKPENAGRYPANWRELVELVRERSGNRCEGSPGFYPDCRAANGEPHPVTGSIVVLTTAHLDHVPEHCDLENLRHMCQRCHLTYDAKHHQETAYMTRRCELTVDMFETSGISGVEK